MLYEQWRECARANRGETALIEASTGRLWTFHELAVAAEGVEPGAGAMTFPRGTGADFVLQTLAGWRRGRLVCPLEAGQAPPAFPDPPPGCAHLKLTSATTGTPKAILFTEEQLAADAEQIVRTMGLRPDWPNLGAISLAHSYGFSNLVTPLLLHGIPLVFADSPLPEAVRRSAARVPCLTVAAVPALWRTWHEAAAIPSNVRLAISAGAPLPLPLEQQVFVSSGLKIHNFYGASECGGIAYDRTARPRSDDACVGAPLEGVRVAVAEDTCLEVRSPAAGETYWPTPGAGLRGGCYHSSDLAELLDGLVFLRGRASDLINVAGRKVSPELIEQALMAHPRAGACLAFGVPSAGAERSEEIVMLVSAPVATLPELQQFLQARLPAWQLPREWRSVPDLAADGRGKLSRMAWRERFLNDRLPEKSS
jgi:long-chain acyl-CoA synthetase